MNKNINMLPGHLVLEIIEFIAGTEDPDDVTDHLERALNLCGYSDGAIVKLIEQHNMYEQFRANQNKNRVEDLVEESGSTSRRPYPTGPGVIWSPHAAQPENK
jgi:hypothetical protein